MPWIKEELRHDQFMDEFWQLILRRFNTGGLKWWPNMNDSVEKIDIYKICYTEGLLEYNENGDHVPPRTKVDGSFCITHHSIMRRHDGEFLGFAQSTGAIDTDSTFFKDNPAELLEQLKTVYKNSIDFTKLYAYMLEDYTHFTHFEGKEGAEALTFITQDHGFGVFNSSMDIEFHTDAYYERGMYQSPYVMINLVGGEIHKIGTVGKLNFATDTNWWADSKVVVQGFIDHKSMSLVFQADSVPYWEEDKTPQIPFFHGNLMRDDEYQEQVALFAGTAIDNPHFDFDNPELFEEIVQPVTRNYVYHPSNGVDTVMLKRSKQGGRYQAHVLSWNAPPNQMQPMRSHIETDIIKEEQVNLLLEVMTFQDRAKVLIEPDTEVITFGPYGIGEDTDVLKDHTHILIGRSEIVELVEFNKEDWWMRVKRIARSPKTHQIGTELLGITPASLSIFSKKYPRAWSQLESEIRSYQFNPSRYNGRVQTSRAYVIHPEAGKVGYLPNVVVAPAISVTNNTILEVNVHCEECDQEEYKPARPPMGDLPKWNPIPTSGILGVDNIPVIDTPNNEIPEGQLPLPGTGDGGGGDDSGGGSPGDGDGGSNGGGGIIDFPDEEDPPPIEVESYQFFLCDHTVPQTNFSVYLNDTLMQEGNGENLEYIRPSYINPNRVAEDYFGTHILYPLDKSGGVIRVEIKEMPNLTDVQGSSFVPDKLTGSVDVLANSRDTVVTISWDTVTTKNNDGTFKVEKFQTLGVNYKRTDFSADFELVDNQKTILITLTPKSPTS